MMRFGPYTFRGDTGELRKHGIRVQLQGQPAKILRALLETPGEIVSRKQLTDLIWSDSIHVDFESGLNASVRKLRQALNDEASQARYIETVPKVGYRFIAPVETVVSPVHAPVETPEAVVEPEPPTVDPEEPVVAPPPPSPGRRMPWVWIGLIAILVLAVGWFWKRTSRPAEIAAGPVRKTVIELGDGLQMEALNGRSVAISPDGRTVAYVAAKEGKRKLYLHALDSEERIQVPGSESAVAPAFSPDGTVIAFLTGSGIHRYRLTDKKPDADLPIQQNNGGQSFVWAGADHFYATGTLANYPGALPRPAPVTGVWQVTPSGSTLQPTQAAGESPEWHMPSALTPDERNLFVTINRTPLERDTMLLDLQSKTWRRVRKQATGMRVLPTGHAIYHWQSKIWGAVFDAKSQTLASEPIPLVDRVLGPWPGADADYSKDGTLVYVPAPAPPEYQLVWADRNGKETPLPIPPGPYRALDVSPDGKAILMSRAELDSWSLWWFDLATGQSQRFSEGHLVEPGAVWCGGDIVYNAAPEGEGFPNLFRRSKDEAGLGVQLGKTTVGRVPQACNGASVVFSEGIHPKTSVDTWMIDSNGTRPLAASAGVESHASVSPDGQWLAFGGVKVAVQRLRDGGGLQTVSERAGADTAWSADGTELYFRQDDQMMVAKFAGGKAGVPQPLFRCGPLRSSQWLRFALFARHAGRFLLIRRVVSPSEGRRIQVVMNWFREVQDRIPVVGTR